MIALRTLGWLPLVGVTAAATSGTFYLQRAEHRFEHRAEHRRHRHGDGRAAALAALGDTPSTTCKHLPDPITLSSGTLELGDLVSWAVRFTCQDIVFDPRIVATGKQLTVFAPQRMTYAEGVELFHAALATLGLAAVPDGNVIRIVEAATVAPVAPAPPAPEIRVAARIDDAAGNTLTSPVVLARDGEPANVKIGDPDRTIALALTPHVHGDQIIVDVSYDERSRTAGGGWTTHALATHAVGADRQPIALTLPDRRLVITPSRMDVGGSRCDR